jgi:pyrroloquinoline quinone (PQQ) biosynthesis protein C
MDLIKRLDEARERRNVLQHPFYRRWTAGELAPSELVGYAREYRHAVVALADATQRAAVSAEGCATPAAAGLRLHAREERDHVALWDEFAAAAAQRDGGVSPHPAEASPQTSACVDAWTAGEDLLEQLAVLYAVEASQPAISSTKLHGLQQHYGFHDDSPGLAYFELHATRDVEHSREVGELLERLASDDDVPRLLERAEAALAGNWALLDGVEARRPAPHARAA